MPNNLSDAEEVRLLDLSLVDGDLLALTTDLPTDSTAGTEVTGGSYARQTIDWAAASAGAKTTAADLVFNDMPAEEVVGWEVLNSAGTARRWYGLWSSRAGSATASTDLINVTAHGLVDDDLVVFQTGFAPTGVTAGTTYFVVSATTNSFQVSATSGGSAVNVSADTASIIVGRVHPVEAGADFTVTAGDLTCSLS